MGWTSRCVVRIETDAARPYLTRLCYAEVPNCYKGHNEYSVLRMGENSAVCSAARLGPITAFNKTDWTI